MIGDRDSSDILSNIEERSAFLDVVSFAEKVTFLDLPVMLDFFDLLDLLDLDVAALEDFIALLEDSCFLLFFARFARSICN